MTGIHVAADNPNFASVDGILFSKSLSTLAQCPGGKTGQVTVSDNVSYILSGAFRDCIHLTDIIVDPENRNYCSIDGILYKKNATEIEQCPAGKTGHVNIPDSVTTIGFSAFDRCTGLTGITIPDSVTFIDKYAFDSCSGLTHITIPDSVTGIEDSTFRKCTGLVSISIPNSVTRIGDRAFYRCTNLTSITIPDSVTSIGNYAFYYCSSLTDITIPSSVTSIGNSAFSSCDSLTSISIPDSVTSIENFAFWFCDNLTSISIPGSVTSIGSSAFAYCDNLTSITFAGDAPTPGGTVFSGVTATAYYPAGNTTWTEAVRKSYGGNITWIAAENSSSLSISGLTVELRNASRYAFLGSSFIYDLNSPNDTGAVYTLRAAADLSVLSFEDITWTSSDPSIFDIGNMRADENGKITVSIIPRAEGTATLTAANPQGESLSLDVQVLKPNETHFRYVYDSKQDYFQGTFYSASSSFSDCVEVYLEFSNAMGEVPCVVEEELAYLIPDIKPITVTAKISGDDLSFSRDSYQNTYTMNWDAIPFGQTVYDLLALYPQSMYDVNEAKYYTLEVVIQSESFSTPITENFSFSVASPEWYRVEEHIDYVSQDWRYISSKYNSYGENMVKLKSDKEYAWSKVSTFDFENYYEVVWTDVVIGLIGNQSTELSLSIDMFAEWTANYSTVLENLSTICNDSYGSVGDVSELALDKLLKASKYTTDGIYADGKVYQKVLSLFGNTQNADKIKNTFAAIDKSGQVTRFFSFGANALKDVIAWVNTANTINAFYYADEELKQVMTDISVKIPDDQRKMKEAIEDYVNAGSDYGSLILEILDASAESMINIGWDALNAALGKRLTDFWIAKLNTWISAKAWAVIGGVTTAVSAGLFISDVISNSEDKAAEAGKLIAMSEYTPYIIATLQEYEQNMIMERTGKSVDLFERALDLHKSSQMYIAEHTASLLEAKGSSILTRVMVGDHNGDGMADGYEETIANALAYRAKVEALQCCSGTRDTSSLVQDCKVIAICCPVDVYIYDNTGNIVIKIIQDTVEYAAENIHVLVIEDEKFILVPSAQDYDVKIVARSSGEMTYAIVENPSSQNSRVLRKASIPLLPDRTFTGSIDSGTGLDVNSYTLTSDTNTKIELENITATHTPGDINGDREVNNKDLTRLFQYLSGYDVEIIEEALDINGDGSVNNKDLTRLFQFLSGYDVEIH